MKRSPLGPLVAAVISAAALAAAVGQTQAPADSADPWVPFRFFVGTWEGQGQGTPGQGRGIQTFDLAPPGRDFTCCSQGVLKRQKGATR